MTGAVNCGYITEDQSSENNATSDNEKRNTNSLTHSRTHSKNHSKSSAQPQRENNINGSNANSLFRRDQSRTISRQETVRNPQTDDNRRRDNSVIITVADITPTEVATDTETVSTVDNAISSSV